MCISDKINKDIKELERKSIGASKSMYKRLMYDFDYLKEIYDTKCYGDSNLFGKNYDYSNIVRLTDYIDIFAEQLKSLSQYIIDLYKSINFYYYGLDSYVNISAKDEKEILYEFLKYFNKELINIYEELEKNGRIFPYDEKNIMGITYCSQELDSYYIGVAPNVGSINRIETLIHELNHIYAFKFASNYSYDVLESLYLGLFGETTTLYSELSLNNFFIENNIMTDEMMKHRNCLDYITLYFYKTMRYVTEALSKTGITTNGIDYRVNDDFRFDLDKNIPFFEYNDNFKAGDLIHISYGVSYIKAYELLSREKAGSYTPEENIKDFIISLQDEKSVLDFLNEPFSFTFMENELLNRKKILEKKYPIPGYTIK